MADIAMRFSGGKDSTLAALRLAPHYDKVHLLTFDHEMISGTEKSKLNIPKMEKLLGVTDKFVHRIIEIGPLIQHFYHGKGYLHDVMKYGTLARAPMCTACDFSMFFQTIIFCVENDLHFASDGSNKSEFAGLADEWAFESIQKFARKHQVEWIFPIWDDPRCDLTLLKEGLTAELPVVMYGNEGSCVGVGLFANIHLRCYFLPKHGVDEYSKRTVAWLEERIGMADDYIAKNVRRGAGASQTAIA